MSQDKVYFSKLLDPEDWGNDDSGFMTFFLVPNKWWSPKAWKFANSMRAEMLKKLAALLPRSGV